jgi:hypothetical protein
MPANPFKIETREGAPIRSGDAEVVLRSRVVQLRLPFANGGIIWNRPLAVSIRRPGAPDYSLPVRDVTRLLQLVLLALGLGGALLLRVAARARNE